jgi:hypothetical protein
MAFLGLLVAAASTIKQCLSSTIAPANATMMRSLSWQSCADAAARHGKMTLGKTRFGKYPAHDGSRIMTVSQ